MSKLLLPVSSKMVVKYQSVTTKNFLAFYLALFFDKIIYKAEHRN